MLNQQIPTKQIQSSGDTLLVHSIFHTIQGEGIFSGHPAVFLRLAGCNLQCPNCDTEYTEGAQRLGIKHITDLIHSVREDNTKLVVITGGEPFRQSLGLLISALTDEHGFTVQIETNGTLFDPTVNYADPNLFIICSPKTGKVHKMLAHRVNAYKYVGGFNEWELSHNPRFLDIKLENHGLMLDGLPQKALGHSAKPYLARPPENYKGKVYLQPIDRQHNELNQLHRNAVVEACMKHGHTLCLQLHKIIQVE